jgi:hypothetical protein
MTITPHALTTDTTKSVQYYSTALYQMLLMFEEGGVLKTQAYTDDKSIPTIGEPKGSASHYFSSHHATSPTH